MNCMLLQLSFTETVLPHLIPILTQFLHRLVAVSKLVKGSLN